jgi:hypothetical protein
VTVGALNYGDMIRVELRNYGITVTCYELLNSSCEAAAARSGAEHKLFYDAAGGMENNGGFQLRYDERNRLDSVTVGALTTT